MKKLLIIALLALAGCGPMTYEQRMAWSEAFKNISRMQHEQNLVHRRPQIIYPGNSTYWNARREYGLHR